MKSFAKPPQDIKELGVAISLMFGAKNEQEWSTFTKLMANPQEFVKNMKSYNFEQMKPALRKKVEAKIATLGGFENMVKKGKAAGECFAFIEGMLEATKSQRDVAQLQKELD